MQIPLTEGHLMFMITINNYILNSQVLGVDNDELNN
jgi:hypothetical protein